MIPDNQLQERLKKFGTWMYRFQLSESVSTPLHVDWLNEVHDTRLRMIFDYLDERLSKSWGDLRCLDAACNEGFFSFELARRGAKSVLGVDIRQESIDKAEFVREIFALDNVTFSVDALERVSDVKYGEFDLTLFLGILYHLDNPMDILRRIRSVTKRLCVIETQVLKGDPVVSTCWGSSSDVRELPSIIGIVEESDFETNPCASSTGLGFVPSKAALISMLRYAGFRNVTQLMPFEGSYEQYANADRVIVVAEV